jgi:hypothetical protein
LKREVRVQCFLLLSFEIRVVGVMVSDDRSKSAKRLSVHWLSARRMSEHGSGNIGHNLSRDMQGREDGNPGAGTDILAGNR